MNDYKNRSYLSAIEVAKYLCTTVKEIHNMVENDILPATLAASGQFRFNIEDVKKISGKYTNLKKNNCKSVTAFDVAINQTLQKVIISNSQNMQELKDKSIHLAITSPPYFNAKMYSSDQYDLGNIHDLDEWFIEIGKVWKEVYRVLQPGRKFFLNIMNLPIRLKEGFKSLNLVGKSIDLCEDIGFIFKRDIIWHKTNGVKAHFGTYPYPGGILINNMHEFILEFNKPDEPSFKKYAHLTKEIKEQSKIDKEFWLLLKNSDVWTIKPEKSGDGRSHIAPFPFELPYRLVKAFSYIGETVLDPFSGSGTTLVASANLGRNGIGYEINDKIAYESKHILENQNFKLFTMEGKS